jgi:hypothetical protein
LAPIRARGVRGVAARRRRLPRLVADVAEAHPSPFFQPAATT